MIQYGHSIETQLDDQILPFLMKERKNGGYTIEPKLSIICGNIKPLVKNHIPH